MSAALVDIQSWKVCSSSKKLYFFQVRNNSHGWPTASPFGGNLLQWNLDNSALSLSFVGKTSVVIAGGRICAKYSRIVPNIPTHDTWLSSIICSTKFWMFLLAFLIKCTSDKVPSLSESTLSKQLVSLPVHKLPLWLYGVTWSGYLSTLSSSSMWCHIEGTLSVVKILVQRTFLFLCLGRFLP